jgi:hypothetical protein
MSALLGRPLALAFMIAAGCGGRAGEPRAIPTDASSSAAYEGGSAVDVVTQTEANRDVTTCAGAQDCMALSLASNSVYCCMDNACVADQPGYCTDANVQLIHASSYDQSCRTDADCVAVTEGNACDWGGGICPNATINKGAIAQYQSDTAKTRAASCTLASSCGVSLVPCCLNGSCRWDVQCSSALAAAGDGGTDAGDASAE